MWAPQTVVSTTEHLRLKLRELDILLERQVLRLRAAHLLTEDQFRGLYIPDDQVDALLSAGGDTERESAAVLTARLEELRSAHEAAAATSLKSGVDLPLLRMAKRFGLSSFDLDVLLIALAPELDSKYSTLFAYAQNDVTKKHPTVDLALNLLCDDFDEKLSRRNSFEPSAPLFRGGLVRLIDDPQDREPVLLSRYLKTDSRVVDEVRGAAAIDARLASFVTLETPAVELEKLALPEDAIDHLHAAVHALGSRRFVVFLRGARGTGRLDAARAVCSALDRRLLVADLAAAPTADSSWTSIAALLRREATLHGAALVLRHFELLCVEDPSTRQQRLPLVQALQSFEGLLFIESETDWPGDVEWSLPIVRIDFAIPAFPLRLRIWKEALASNGHGDAQAAQLAARFVLSGGDIRRAVRKAEQIAYLGGRTRDELTAEDLHRSARDQSVHALHRLGQKIETAYAWSDIVLPQQSREQLEEVRSAVEYRHTVLTSWAFDKRLGMASGINVLFSGPSGTGKTMAASILAAELGLELWRLDLAGIVSKYIGETEKNLSRIFHEARSSNAILFFDEADALFGKRSEVKDAHDRYANIEVAYLLQQMESYDGVVILATNLSRNLDEAFTRRMHHIVEFPLPDAAARERIWRGMFPSAAPVARDVDFQFLARHFEMTGGNIRNAVFAAAIAAASQKQAIGMEHLILGTARELQKLNKIPTASQFRQYYELVKDRV